MWGSQGDPGSERGIRVFHAFLSIGKIHEALGDPAYELSIIIIVEGVRACKREASEVLAHAGQPAHFSFLEFYWVFACMPE